MTGTSDQTREDRGPVFDGLKIGRPAVGALIDAGYRRLSDLPDDIEVLADLHGVGPRAVRLLKEGRAVTRTYCANLRDAVPLA